MFNSIYYFFQSVCLYFCVIAHRFVNVLVYYGLSLGVSRLGTDLYLTQFIFGLVEIPARTLVLFVLPYSRRLCQSGFLATGGLSCLLVLAIPAGRRGVLLTCQLSTNLSPSLQMLPGSRQVWPCWGSLGYRPPLL